MAFRYKLHPLGPTDTADDLLKRVYSNGTGSGLMLSDGSPKRPWSAVFDHLKAIGTKTILVQSEVRDPDFLEEHRAFYSKQHRTISSMCVRVHAFSCELENGVEPDVLSYLDAAVVEKDCYLGFVTVRPLRHAPVGVSILLGQQGRTATE